jgi:hypothetical protein
MGVTHKGDQVLTRWPPPPRKANDGDPDPISAGTAGEAVLWGGSSAAVGMAANPFGAHQADSNDQLRARLSRFSRPCWD